MIEFMPSHAAALRRGYALSLKDIDYRIEKIANKFIIRW